MTKQPLVLALTLTPLILMGGCDSLPFLGGGEEENLDFSAPAATDPVPAAPAGAENAEGEGFEDPLVESDDTPEDPAAAEGLIPLASRDAASKLAQSGRKDPFATLPVNAAKLAANNQGQGTTTAVTTALPKLPDLPPFPTLQIPQIGPFAPEPEPPTPPAPPAAPTGFPDLPDIPTEEPFSPELPPLPEPTVATSLRVTGVMMAKGVAHALVEGEGFKSTYVKEGDYVANGQVLVKRIEATKGGPALVVFEELGIEVVKNVGEGGELPTG